MGSGVLLCTLHCVFRPRSLSSKATRTAREVNNAASSFSIEVRVFYQLLARTPYMAAEPTGTERETNLRQTFLCACPRHHSNAEWIAINHCASPVDGCDMARAAAFGAFSFVAQQVRSAADDLVRGPGRSTSSIFCSSPCLLPPAFCLTSDRPAPLRLPCPCLLVDMPLCFIGHTTFLFLSPPHTHTHLTALRAWCKQCLPRW